MVELLKLLSKNESLMNAIEKSLGNQLLMDIIGSIYKTEVVKKVLDIVLQLITPPVEKYMPPKNLSGIFEKLDLPENDELMEKISSLLITAFTNLAPSEKLF